MTFHDLQIETGGKTKGKTHCPKCHHERKNKKDKSLSFDTDKGVYKCHHCDWSGTIKERSDTPDFSNFFLDRGISPYTLQKLSIYEEKNTIKFPYYQDGKKVNTKSRPLWEKTFYTEKGGKSIPYNIDSVNGDNSVIITEGEMDVLSFIEAGFNSVISPPFGANDNLNWVDDKLKLLDRIYLSIDKDSKGELLRNALIKHFGEKKCFIIDTGKYKDANELLMANGVKGVKDAVKNATNDTLKVLKELLEKHLLDPDENIEKPKVALNIADKIFGTLGNMSLITGKGKAKKTFLASALAAASIGAETLDMFWSEVEGICIYFDNEQSKYHGQIVQRRIIELGGDKKRIKYYNFRELNTDQRLEMIDFALENEKNNITLVIIDGVRDLLRDINSPDESTKIADYLLRWTSRYNIHIINLLHQNKADKNPRGHIGSELVNKSETVVAVERWEQDETVSVVKPEYTRNIEFDEFFFNIDDNGLPQKYDVSKPNKNNAKVKPSDLVHSSHQKMIDWIFGINSNYSASEFKEMTRSALRQFKFNVGRDRSVDFINHWMTNKYIRDDGTGQKRKYVKNEQQFEPDF
jgi:5S rRNA maturation endonuclease (ribonuclease M5)